MNEDKKMLEIIHDNCKKEQLKREIAKMENKKNNKKREIKEIVILLLIIATLLGLIAIINKHNLNTCIKNGGSETFCRYAGE